MMSRLAFAVAEIGERARDAPAVTGFAEDGKCAFIRDARGGQITLLPRDVRELVNRPGCAAAITNLLENLCRLVQRPASARIIAANLDNICQIVKAARNGRPVRQQTPTRETPLKITLRRGVVAAIAGRNRERVQRGGDAPLISQLVIERKTLLESTGSCGKIALSG